MADILFVIFATLATVIAFLLVSLCALLLKIFIGKSFKNPHYAPVIGTVLDQLFYFDRLYDYQTEVARKHPTFRILAPSHSEIYTTDPRIVEHIAKINFHKYSKAQYDQDILQDLLGHGIFNVDGDKWIQQRKLSVLEFSTRNLRDFSCVVFRTKAATLAGTIADIMIKNKTFDFQDIVMKCTLDIIFKVGFGVDLNCLEGSNQEGSLLLSAFNDSDELVYWRNADPIWRLKRFLNIGSEAVLHKNLNIVNDFVYGVIKSKRMQLSKQGESNDKDDILSRFIMESKNNPKEITDRYLRDVILNFTNGGKDGTANTLSWMFYMLCKHPLIQEKLAQQVIEVVDSDEKETNIDDFVSKLTDDKLEKMHYLQAALTETLRLYPTAPVDGRCSKVDDILPGGFRVKKGDGVYYMGYAMGRMTSVWGEDAEDFRPERWLNNGDFQPQSPYKFVAFHAGPRICLGKDFAYRQMKIISMVLLRFFRFKLADETKNATYRTMSTLNINGGLHLRAISRLDMTN